MLASCWICHISDNVTVVLFIVIASLYTNKAEAQPFPPYLSFDKQKWRVQFTVMCYVVATTCLAPFRPKCISTKTPEGTNTRAQLFTTAVYYRI